MPNSSDDKKEQKVVEEVLNRANTKIDYNNPNENQFDIFEMEAGFKKALDELPPHIHKIMICLPAAAPNFSRDFMECFSRMKDYFNAMSYTLGKTFVLTEYWCRTFPINANRNQLAQMALNIGVDTTIWLDMDQTFPIDTLVKLMKPDNPIVGGIYYLKKAPFHPVVFKALDPDVSVFQSILNFPKSGEYFFADMMGMGCCRIDIEVFKQLKQPYFAYSKTPTQLKTPVAIWKAKHGIEDVSEDVHFFREVAKKTNIRPWVDGSIICGHISRIIVDDVLSDNFLQGEIQAFINRNGQEAFEREWIKVCTADMVKNGTFTETLKPVLQGQTETTPETTGSVRPRKKSRKITAGNS